MEQGICDICVEKYQKNKGKVDNTDTKFKNFRKKIFFFIKKITGCS